MTDHGLSVGTPEIRSVGPIAFGPDAILFVADNVSAKVIAVDVQDPGAEAGTEAFELENVDTHLASFLGCEASDVLIQDVAVHPKSHNIYLSVQRGRGDGSQPVIIRIDRDGAITDVSLDNVPFAETAIDHAPAEDDERFNISLSIDPEGEPYQLPDGQTIHLARLPMRTGTVTDMSYVDGALLVAGLSNEEFSSRLRRIPFPFGGQAADAGLEIFHVSHGKWETEAPIRSFVPYDNGRAILAAYTCTPVVHIPLAAATEGKIVGRTVAELGYGNQPLDMVSFRRDGQEHLLVANSRHGLVKIDYADIEGQPGLTEPREPVGVPRTTEQLTGVMRMDNLGTEHVLVLRTDGTRKHLVSLKADSL